MLLSLEGAPNGVLRFITKMPLPSKRLRFSAKNFFLTYPQCSITKEDAMAQLIALPLPSNKKFIRVAIELHGDGRPHLHVLIQLGDKLHITNKRLFDLHQHQSSHGFHPNMQSAKSSLDVKVYVEKGGDYVGSIDELLQIMRYKDPRSFYLQYHNLKANIKHIFDRPLAAFQSKWPYSSFHATSGIQQWIASNFHMNTTAPLEEYNIFIIKET